jgi:hypothetical protein
MNKQLVIPVDYEKNQGGKCYFTVIHLTGSGHSPKYVRIELSLES